MDAARRQPWNRKIGALSGAGFVDKLEAYNINRVSIKA